MNAENAENCSMNHAFISSIFSQMADQFSTMITVKAIRAPTTKATANAQPTKGIHEVERPIVIVEMHEVNAVITASPRPASVSIATIPAVAAAATRAIEPPPGLTLGFEGVIGFSGLFGLIV